MESLLKQIVFTRLSDFHVYEKLVKLMEDIKYGISVKVDCFNQVVRFPCP
jgi:hypothetical protein